jgi:hypothetical protein
MKIAGAACCVLAFGLAACTPPNGQTMNGQNGQMNGQQNPQPDGLNGNMYASNGQQPAPYMQPSGQQPSQWPGANNGNWQPAPPAPNGQPVRMQPPSNEAAPAGMKQIPSQAGKVYRTTLSGQGPIPQQSRDFYMKLMPYFDAQPQVMGYMDEPSGRMAQVGFQSTKNGQPVMGMLMVTQASNGGAVAVVMLDSPQTFQQSMQTMMAAAQQP